MSKTYEQCCKEVGLDNTNITPPEQKKIWFAYEGGKAIRCETPTEAKKHKLYEVVLDPESKEQILKFWDQRKELELKAANIFHDSIRSDYSGMSDELFELCYDAAKEWSRSSDYEEIPDNFEKFSKFAQKAIKLRK